MRSVNLRRTLSLLPLEQRDCPALFSGAVDLDFTIDPVTGIPKNGFGAKCASDFDGHYVLSYWSTDNNIFARIYDENGLLLTDEFQVTTSGNELERFVDGQPDYDVAMNQDGHIVFIWSNEEGGTWGRAFNYDVTAQKVTPVSDPTQLTQYYDFNLPLPLWGSITNIDIDLNEVGLVRVVGQGIMKVADPPPVFSFTDVFTFTVANGNTTQGLPFMVNTFTEGAEVKPAVALDYSGAFVITWERGTMSGESLWYRKFGSNGLPVPSSGITDVPVGVGLAGQQGIETFGHDPEVAIVRGANPFPDNEMNFVIMWEGTQFRRYNRLGNPVSPDLYIADVVQGGSYPQLDIGVRGDMYMVWCDDPFSPPSDPDVRGRLYDKAAIAQTPVFEVPAFDGNPGDPPRLQSFPHVAQGGGGNFVAVWQDGSPGGGPRARFHRWLPPRVESVKVNDGNAQRSMVKTIEVTFDSYVSLNLPQPVEIRNTANNLMLLSFTTANIDSKTHLHITVDSSYVGGSLPDGDYTLTLNCPNILDYEFLPLDGNNDGIGGDNFTFNFHRYYGDSDGDRDVDAIDYVAFRNVYGTSSFTFDYESNGIVGASDFAQFRLRYGTSL